jgi:hypothetical protein
MEEEKAWPAQHNPSMISVTLQEFADMTLRYFADGYVCTDSPDICMPSLIMSNKDQHWKTVPYNS